LADKVLIRFPNLLQTFFANEIGDKQRICVEDYDTTILDILELAWDLSKNGPGLWIDVARNEYVMLGLGGFLLVIRHICLPTLPSG
jgi:hypothetical protein